MTGFQIPAPESGRSESIGGGVMRDLLLSRVPVVFQSDIYALAALAGALLVVLGHWLGWSETPTAIAGALLILQSLSADTPAGGVIFAILVLAGVVIQAIFLRRIQKK